MCVMNDTFVKITSMRPGYKLYSWDQDDADFRDEPPCGNGRLYPSYNQFHEEWREVYNVPGRSLPKS